MVVEIVALVAESVHLLSESVERDEVAISFVFIREAWVSEDQLITVLEGHICKVYGFCRELLTLLISDQVRGLQAHI